MRTGKFNYGTIHNIRREEKMSRHTIEVFGFCVNSFIPHIIILLVQRNVSNPNQYYSYWIDRTNPADERPIKIADDPSAERRMEDLRTASAFNFLIHPNYSLKYIAKKWVEKQALFNNDPRSSLCVNNCADASEWFLEEFADIEKSASCAKPISCDYVGFGCWLPSFFQCCTLPGRVVSNTQHQLEKISTAPDMQGMQ